MYVSLLHRLRYSGCWCWCKVVLTLSAATVVPYRALRSTALRRVKIFRLRCLYKLSKCVYIIRTSTKIKTYAIILDEYAGNYIEIMTLINSFDETSTPSNCKADESDWNSLYCSHLWKNSALREAIIAPNKDTKRTNYCYTCRGKIRSYGVTTPNDIFSPNTYSTPKLDLQKISPEVRNVNNDSLDSSQYKSTFSNRKTSISDININNDKIISHIPTISRQLEASFRNKYKSGTNDVSSNLNQKRLRKSLKGIGCVVNWSLTESPKRRRTQIQVCSIGLMITAILVISVILVNYTTLNYKQLMNNTIVQSTVIVPTENIEINETSSAVVNFYTDLFVPKMKEKFSTEKPILSSTKNNSRVNNIVMKIRKNIKTYPKDAQMKEDIGKLKDVINRSLSNKFCSCQTNEVCMLDEESGTSICKLATDIGDPTGCGGLCAMETEACQLVDKSRGVRVCRLITQVLCSSSDWRCRNGFCVPLEARCDGSVQCYDRSDEMYCECDLTKQFRCGHSISCFPKTKLCDGFIDCWDGHDELNCTMECPEDQFTCTNGECIMSSRFCDGLADCGDGSDEPQGCDSACGTHEMQCKNRRCVPLGVKCDGRDDCGDNSDEKHCS